MVQRPSGLNVSMHFEFLVEGQTELTVLSILMEKIIGVYGKNNTWKIHKHRGIGELPDDPKVKPDKNNPTLLHNLPSKLQAYGKEQLNNLVIVILVDLDDNDCRKMKERMQKLLDYCPKKPNAWFCLAIEELEAWFLGDHQAIKQAYPAARLDILDSYKQDSICGTWEKLAEIIYPDGFEALIKAGTKRSISTLKQKQIWAKKISQFMDVDQNLSPSFQYFRDGLKKYTGN